MITKVNGSKISVHRFIATTLFVCSKGDHTHQAITNRYYKLKSYGFKREKAGTGRDIGGLWLLLPNYK